MTVCYRPLPDFHSYISKSGRTALTAAVKARESVALAGRLKLIAVIEEPAVIEKILKHIGLDSQPTQIAPARRPVELFEAVEAAWVSAGVCGPREWLGYGTRMER